MPVPKQYHYHYYHHSHHCIPTIPIITAITTITTIITIPTIPLYFAILRYTLLYFETYLYLALKSLFEVNSVCIFGINIELVSN